MARYITDWTFQGRHKYDDDEYWERYISNLRDGFRIKTQGSEIIVSDIGYWDNGLTSQSNGHPYCFIIKISNIEFAIVVHRNRYVTSSGSRRMDRLFGGDGYLGFFWGRDISGSTITSNSESGFYIFFNNSSGSWVTPMGFDDPVNMTYSNGDFQHTAINPYTHFSDWHPGAPGQNISPVVMNDPGWSSSLSRVFFILNDTTESEFVAIYTTDLSRPFIKNIGIIGNIFINDDPSDTNHGGLFVQQLDFTYNTNTAPQRYVEAFGLNGQNGSEVFNITHNTNATVYNSPNTEGQYPWWPVEVTSSSYSKGWINTDILRVCGANDITHYGKLFSGPDGPFLKLSDWMIYPYVQDHPMLPFPPQESDIIR